MDCRKYDDLKSRLQKLKNIGKECLPLATKSTGTYRPMFNPVLMAVCLVICMYICRSGLQLIFVIQPFVHQNKHINCKHSSMAFIESVERPQMAQNRIKRDWEGQTSIFLGLTYGAIQKIFYRNMMKLDQIGSSYCYCDALLSHAWFILTTCIFFFKFCQFIYMYMFF